MPVMGGLEALRKIRALDPQAQVVVVTALDQKQALMDSIRDGAIDFIVKPFERDAGPQPADQARVGPGLTARAGDG